MKRLLIIAIALFATGSAYAQPWMKGHENGRVKLRDVIAGYSSSAAAAAAEEDDEDAMEQSDRAVGEKKNYHFDRWVWYAQQHLDSEGYIVPDAKTFQEWMAYLQNGHGGHSTAKGTAAASNWVFKGPSTTASGYRGIGRVQAIAFHPTDSNTFWVGTGGGGAWKTTNNGVTWNCMTDMLPVLGVAEIVINPLNPQVVYLCTGDRDASDNYSVGVLKSTDGGLTWNATGYAAGVQQGRFTNSLAMNPLDTSTLVLAASNGIYKTNNSGATWTQVKTGSYKQIMYRPYDSNVVFAAGYTTSGMWGIYRSANAGNSWSTAFSLASTSRIAIAISPAAPNTVKAVVANSYSGLEGVYNAVDTGKTFARIFDGTSCSNNILSSSLTLSASSCSGQAWYDLALAISPLDSNKLIIGGVNTYQSTNGGTSWSIVTQWYAGLPGVKTVHADKHCLAFQPLRPGVLFEGNDGGIYKTLNPASQIWNDLSNGLCVTQFYRNAVSEGANFVLGGAQDNGTKQINFSGSSIEQTGGDGMECAIDDTDPTVFYTAQQNGTINRTENGGANFSTISGNIPGQPSGAWVTPYILDPKQPSTIYAGYGKVYRSDDRGDSWYAISPQLVSGQNITRLAATTADDSTLYAVVNNQVRYTTTGGSSWNMLTLGAGGSISDIIVSPKDARHIWITYSGYSSAKVYEFDTVNGWTNHSAGLPNIPVNCITIDNVSGTVYIGTDAAVFYLDSAGTWQLFNNNLPAAQVRDLGINYTNKEIWAATYGRGMWKSPKRDQGGAHASGLSTIPLAAGLVSITPNPATDGKFNITTSSPALIGQNVSIAMTDMNGRTIWKAIKSFNGSGTMHIDAGALPRGQYMLQLKAENGTSAKARVSLM